MVWHLCPPFLLTCVEVFDGAPWVFARPQRNAILVCRSLPGSLQTPIDWSSKHVYFEMKTRVKLKEGWNPIAHEPTKERERERENIKKDAREPPA